MAVSSARTMVPLMAQQMGETKGGHLAERRVNCLVETMVLPMAERTVLLMALRMVWLRVTHLAVRWALC